MNKLVTGAVHFVICGSSTEHIRRIIRDYDPVHLELFTTIEMLEIAKNFLDSESGGIPWHINVVHAFDSNAIEDMISVVSQRYDSIILQYPWKRVYFGITGGTNTMAVAMAFAAFEKQVDIHYFLKSLKDNEDSDPLVMDPRKFNRNTRKQEIARSEEK